MADKIEYKKVLNPSQLEAVMTDDGPVLVIAGAGSGKTRTLVYRVARLVEKGIPPEAILLLTFTRKAATEMLERAARLADDRCRFVAGGTFHSLALKVLRIHAHLLNYENSFTILDRADMEEVIQSLIPRLSLSRSGPRFPKRSTLANILSKAANLEKSIEELITNEYGQFLDLIDPIAALAGLYNDYKREHQLMDYDDLILNLRKLLKEREEVRHRLSSEYRFVMVDEYQDTNKIQADIVKWLAVEHRNIMVVGDDSQSIYSFRGANYRNMFDFPGDFPEAKKIKLEENYRSVQPVLTFTNALMEQAEEQFTKCLFTKRKGGEAPRVINTRTEPEQALFVCSFIREQLQMGRSIKDFSVLFRAAYHSFELEAELTRQGFHYVKYGGFKFLESAHIKDFLAHLRVVANSGEAVSWVRILRLIRNVGRAKSQALIQWMTSHGIPPGGIGEWPGAGKGRGGLKALAELLSRLSHRDIRPDKAVQCVIEYYSPILKERFDDYPKRQRDLEQLVPMAGRYHTLRSFLDDLVLDPPTSSADLGEEDSRESLTLSTVHSAKGLEWPVVLVIWVTDGRFPSARAYSSPFELEEERRLMYVAATRAKDQLILCYPGEEKATGLQGAQPWGGGFKSDLSSFIRSLPSDILSHESGSRVRSTSIPSGVHVSGGVSDFRTSGGTDIRQGEKVKHPAFGPGVVSRLVGNDKVEVLFRNVGRKLLQLEHTTLEKI